MILTTYGREQRIARDDVALVGDVDDRATRVLIALGDVVDGVDQRDVGDRELRVVALAREGREIDDGDVGLRPRRAGTIEHLAVEALAEHVHGVGHLEQPGAPCFGHAGIAAALAQRIPHVLRQHGSLLCDTATRGIDDALANQAAIGAGHARFFLVLAAR